MGPTWILIGLVGIAVACDRAGETAPTAPPPPVVGVVTVTPRTIANQAALLGQLQAEQSVMVRSEVAGIIDAIEFEEGQAVSQGQVLFRLRDEEPLARLHEAETALRLAEANHARSRDLAAQGIVAQSQLDDTTAAFEAARARLEVARVVVARTRIVAPFDGYAGPRLVSLGARIEPEYDLVTVESIARLELAFQLPELALPLAHIGVPVDIRVAPYPDRVFSGAISFVAPSLNPQNRRLLVKARVPNADLALRPGLFATVQARLGERSDVLAVPESALVYGDTGTYVWRIGERQTADTAPVVVGARQDGLVEISSGLQAGDVIVAAGTNKLAPGIQVEAVSAAEPTPAPPPGEASP